MEWSETECEKKRRPVLSAKVNCYRSGCGEKRSRHVSVHTFLEKCPHSVSLWDSYFLTILIQNCPPPSPKKKQNLTSSVFPMMTKGEGLEIYLYRELCLRMVIYLPQDKLPIVCRYFTKNSVKIFLASRENTFLFDFWTNDVNLLFHQVTKSFQRNSINLVKIFQLVQCGYTINLLLSNCSLCIENIQNLVFRTRQKNGSPYMETTR